MSLIAQEMAWIRKYWEDVLTNFDNEWQICKCNIYIFSDIIEKTDHSEAFISMMSVPCL